jgi:formylglycine-generating enzyme required for sulfatase activity
MKELPRIKFYALPEGGRLNRLWFLIPGLLFLGGIVGCVPGGGTTTSIPTFTPAPTFAISSTATPALQVGSTSLSPQDGMVMMYIPAGEFTMGSDKPVFLDAYWIDSTEVTNAKYAICVSAGECRAPVSNISSIRSSYYDNSEFAEYPVIYVDWNQAQTYCEWRGGSLPTEAQ